MLLRLFALWTAASLRLLGARRRRFRAGPVDLVVHHLGPADGEPWVLLHGLGSTGLSWWAVARRLRRDCRLLIPELSSHGGTRAPGAGLNVKEGVAAITALIERELPGRKPTLAGISLGGWIATRLALARPDLVARLLLVDSGGYRNQDWNRISELVRVERIEDVDRLYGALFHRTPTLLDLGRRAFFWAYRSPAVRHVLDSLEPADAFSEADLATLDCPVGLVWGAHDGLFTLDVARAMEAALPRGRLRVLSDCGHSVQWECSRALADATEDFRRHSASGQDSLGRPATPPRESQALRSR